MKELASMDVKKQSKQTEDLKQVAEQSSDDREKNKSESKRKTRRDETKRSCMLNQ